MEFSDYSIIEHFKLLITLNRLVLLHDIALRHFIASEDLIKVVLCPQ